MAVSDKHPHYHKSVGHLETIDVYRVLERFNVTDPALQHAIKKLLVAGGRGLKDLDKDIQEAIDTLTRFQEMRQEDLRTEPSVGEVADDAFREVLSRIQRPAAPLPMLEAVKQDLARRKRAKKTVSKTGHRERTVRVRAARGRG